MPAWPTAALLLGVQELLAQGPQLQQQPSQACTNDCLQEALAVSPTRGCAATTFWSPHAVGAVVSGVCLPCSLGFYCPGSPYGEYPSHHVNLNRRVACTVGTYMDRRGAQSLSECTSCEKGRYQDWHGKSACKLCPAGMYLDAVKSDAVADCVPCPTGHYCPEGSPVPTACPVGTYVMHSLRRALQNCLACPKGHYCPLASVNPTPCPAGSWANSTGLPAAAQCTLCSRGFFCPVGSIVPTACPAGTISNPSAGSVSGCTDCPVGQRCRTAASPDTMQTLVVRTANGFPVTGSANPEACVSDTAVLHYSYPSLNGCIEHCPFNFTRQSYCHMRGDGRWPDRGARELLVADVLAERSRRSVMTQVTQNAALTALSSALGAMTVAQRHSAMAMVDENGRTSLIVAAMMDDVAVLNLLWNQGSVSSLPAAMIARDGGGFTALMHALWLGASAAVTWLTAAPRNGKLASWDAKELMLKGVDVSTLPFLATATEEATLFHAPAHLGRGGLAWTHPGLASFVGSGVTGFGSKATLMPTGIESVFDGALSAALTSFSAGGSR